MQNTRREIKYSVRRLIMSAMEPEGNSKSNTATLKPAWTSRICDRLNPLSSSSGVKTACGTVSARFMSNSAAKNGVATSARTRSCSPDCMRPCWLVFGRATVILIAEFCLP